ncbi:MAG TPA: response regulator [Actinomycetota bacterium]|nr:response regulator [Actinomycetota bacterium]
MGPRRVLVVDDDPTIRDVLQTMLDFEGCEVVVASDGNTAIDTARRLQPDVVLLDVMMPGMNGVEVCRLLKAESDPPKVVMVTAKSSILDQAAGRGAGADAYLTKPFSPLQVLTLLGVDVEELRD